MMTLTLAQQNAIIATMPHQTVREADDGLFHSIAAALCLMPSLSLIACLIEGFAARGLSLDPVAASRVARALAGAEEGRAAGLGAILLAQAERLRLHALA